MWKWLASLGGGGRESGHGSAAAAPAPGLPEAIAKSREAIDVLEKRQEHLETRIRAQLNDARAKAAAGDKRGALVALKRRHLYERELEQLSNAHLTLEQQIVALESAQTQRLAVGALAAGVSAQKSYGLELHPGKIDELVEDMQETAARQSEIASVLAPLTGATGGVMNIPDDAALLAELEAMEAKHLDEALADAAIVPSVAPGALASAPPARDAATAAADQEEDDRQLADLMQQLNAGHAGAGGRNLAAK